MERGFGRSGGSGGRKEYETLIFDPVFPRDQPNPRSKKHTFSHLLMQAVLTSISETNLLHLT
jgi:hypothetical protein